MNARRVGPYELERLLGEGGIGQVYAARDTVLGRQVAIKTLRTELANDQQLMGRFLIEAKSLGRLAHPNITTIYTLHTEGEDVFMVMELVRGQTLEALLARAHRLDLVDALAVIAQAAAGLDYAHQNGIIHRDVKPSNLMITDDGVLKIMDFGIARMQGAQNLTRMGDFQGTLSFASPEQIRGEPIEERTDQYSLAIVLYKMLIGVAPFVADNDYALMTAHLQNTPPALAGRVPGLGGETEAALMRALAKQPDERFASVEDFAEAVGAAEIRGDAVELLRRCVAAIGRGDAGDGTLVTSRPRSSVSSRRARGSFSGSRRSVLREAVTPAVRDASQPPLRRRAQWPGFAAAGAVGVIAAASGWYFFLTPKPEGPPTVAAAPPKSAATPLPALTPTPNPQIVAEPGTSAPQEPAAPPPAAPTPSRSEPAPPVPAVSTAPPAQVTPGAPLLPTGPATPSQSMPSQPAAADAGPSPPMAAQEAPSPTVGAAPTAYVAEGAEPVAPPVITSQPEASPGPSPPTGEAAWSLDEKRGVQEALRTLGYLASVADGDFGPQTRAAIAQFQSVANEPESGQLSEGERTQLLAMAERLASLISAPPTSPKGVAAASVRGGPERLSRAASAAGDNVEAAYWYRTAAAAGEAKAFTNLGTLLVRGVGADKSDPAAARLLWLTAAARGEPISMFNLGAMYERGIGVDGDLAIARKWYERAAAHGRPEARAALKRLNP